MSETVHWVASNIVAGSLAVG